MKILVLLLLFPSVALSQQKRDTKIIVKATDTTNLFNRLALVFYEQGYTLEQKDDRLNFIATTEKKLNNWEADLKIRALIKESTIILTGYVALNVDILFKTKEKSYDPVEYRGAKGSIYMDSWNEIMKIARLFGTEISYTK